MVVWLFRRAARTTVRLHLRFGTHPFSEEIATPNCAQCLARSKEHRNRPHHGRVRRPGAGHPPWMMYFARVVGDAMHKVALADALPAFIGNEIQALLPDGVAFQAVQVQTDAELSRCARD